MISDFLRLESATSASCDEEESDARIDCASSELRAAPFVSKEEESAVLLDASWDDLGECWTAAKLSTAWRNPENIAALARGVCSVCKMDVETG